MFDNSRGNIQSEGDEDFDFNEDGSMRSFDRNSRRSGDRGNNFGNNDFGYNNNNVPSARREVNPMLGGHNLGNEQLAQEREEIDVRGQILKERLQNHEGEDEAADHLRIGGNYINVKDPNKPPYSCFYLMVSG